MTNKIYILIFVNFKIKKNLIIYFALNQFYFFRKKIKISKNREILIKTITLKSLRSLQGKSNKIQEIFFTYNIRGVNGVSYT